MRDIKLDQLRALAAFLVFTWHFCHSSTGYPVPFGGAPRIFPFATLDEGHVGVALFMTLSGYLFASILNGKSVNYPAFLLKRGLRLFPLLMVMFALVGFEQYWQGQDVSAYVVHIIYGFITPDWPHGGWSIATELQFYLLLPFLLLISRKSVAPLVLVLLLAVGIRAFIHLMTGSVQWYAYWTLIGRIDQFLLGIIAFHYSNYARARHISFSMICTAFLVYYWWFDDAGGWMTNGGQSTSRVWVIMPTIEGAFFGFLIAYYDKSFGDHRDVASRLIAEIGKCSYSIYILQFFYVFWAADFVNRHVILITNFYLAAIWSLIAFLLFFPVAWLSFVLIERPLMSIKIRYIR